MSGYPNYNSPQSFKPPVYNPPPLGPQFTPPGADLGVPKAPKKSGGGNGCVLAAFLVFLFVGVPLLVACAGIGYFVVFVVKNVEEARAKIEQDHARMREDAAKGFPNGLPQNFPNDFPGGLPNINPGFPPDRKVASVQDAIDALNSGDWQRQKQGAEWLASNPVDEAKRGEAAKALEGQLSSIHRDIAENCLKALGAWGSKENSPRVITAMKEYRLDRKLAIEQLGKWQDPLSSVALAEFLDDGGSDGEAAFKALEQIGPPAQAAVRAYLDPKRPRANQRAEKLLTGYGVDVADATITAHIARLKTNDFFQRNDSIKALAAMTLKPERQTEVARALDAFMGGNDRQGREEAMAALLVWGDKESLAGVVRYLKSETFVNKNALTFLSKFKEPEALEAMALLLDNLFVDDTELTKALAAFGEEGEKAVLKSLHDPRRKARDRARAVLTKLDTKPDTLLTQTLTDLTSPEDQRARSALEWLATATVDESRKKEVTGKLIEATRHPSPFVQGPAAEALVKLNDPATVPDLAALLINGNAKGQLQIAFFKAGAAAEDLLIGLLTQDDPGVVMFAIQRLRQSGTAKCLGPLQEIVDKAEAAKDQSLLFNARTAHESIKRRAGG